MKKFVYFVVVIFVIVGVDTHGVQGGAMVTGSVFCDQCRDGQVSLFDYPLSGMKVTMLCPGSDGQMTVVGEDTTNMLGNYGITFDGTGTPDLSTCFTQISPDTSGHDPNSCGSTTGPPKSVRLMFNMFDMEMYAVDPLISQPSQPVSFCSSSSPSTPSPVPVSLPPPTSSNPPPVAVTPSTPPKSPTPEFRIPPLPKLPPFVMPPAPFLQSSACSYDYWMKAEYKCYWRAVSPDMTIAEVFGPLAAQKYGTDLTLYASLNGKGDPYKALLREAVTSLLNSWNSLRFPYFAPQVVHNFNLALMGSTDDVLHTALKFKRANTGSACKFEICK